MYRRTVVAGSTAVLLAGCSELTSFTDDGYVDSTVQDEQTAEFNAEAGEELTVTVENVAVAEPENETTVEPTAISFRLDHAENGPIETRSLSESET
jgi:outer membrane lipoprotein SlyB